MSKLSAIVDAIVALPIGGITRVYRGATLKNAITIADTPCRIVSSIGLRMAAAQSIGMGADAHIEAGWTILDIALIRPAGMGQGLRGVAPDMETYLMAYHDAAQTLGDLQWGRVSLTLTSQTLEWAQNTNTFFDAVIATYGIRE